jgi:Putative DNA-binding domain
MSSLLEIQRRMRDAVAADEAARALLPLLAGGRDPAARLAIHRHHYQASLTRALLDKFPAVTWLAGERFATAAAQAFTRAHPPAAPCIAEYGTDYPAFLASRAGAGRLPYLRAFAELERHLGQASIAVDCEPLTIKSLASIDAAELPDHRLTLQGGLRYCAAAWPIDDLIKQYLSGAAPERYAFSPADVHLEIRGSRGEFRIERIPEAELVFRSTIAGGATIGAAAERTLDINATFDPGQALLRLVSTGLVIAIDQAETTPWTPSAPPSTPCSRRAPPSSASRLR